MADLPHAYVGKTVVNVRIADLTPHPDNQKYFGPPNPAEAAALRADIARQGLRTPLIMCGLGCASPRYRILGGHQRVEALRALGMTEAPAIEVNDLNADDELDILLGDNVAAARARKLTQRQLYNIEEAHRKILGRRAGQRSDLTGAPKGETNRIVAKKTGGQTNAVNNRQKVFGSNVSPSDLQDDVDAERVSLTKGAAIVRDLERCTVAERLFAESMAGARATTMTEARPASAKNETKEKKKKSAKNDKRNDVVTYERAERPPHARSSTTDATVVADMSDESIRARIQRAAIGAEQSRRELVDAIGELLCRFPSAPSSRGSVEEWTIEVQETWLPLIADLQAFVESQNEAKKVVLRAVAALAAISEAG